MFILSGALEGVNRGARAAPSSRIAHLVLLSAIALSLVVARPSTASAEGLHIKVRGSARLTARASRDQGDVVLSGMLADDAGQPIGGETVSVFVARESAPDDSSVAQALRAARGCERGADRPPTTYGVRVAGATEAPEILVVTDEGGRFCLRATLPPPRDRHVARLEWKGSPLVDAAEARFAFDLSRQALVLRFDPTPRVVSLDGPRTAFEVSAVVDEDDVARVARGLPLVLASERGELGRAITDAAGRARFSVDARALGPPGPGELRVSFAGDADIAFASHAAPLERHVKVTMRVPALDEPDVAPMVPEDGIPLAVDVTSAAGPVGEGGVEARIGEMLVGSAPVEAGVARLTVTFAAQDIGRREAQLRLRYVPSAPWYEPVGDAVVRLPVRGPGLASKLPLVVAGAAVLAFFLLGRASSRQRKPEPEPAKPGAPARVPEARIEIVREAARGERGWRGRLLDAHEGSPIANARVWVERGTFDGRTVLASTSTDASGRFELQAELERVGDERLAAEASLHASLVQPLPAAGELTITLVLRRRALLQRLVAWAKRRGPPFDERPEPTPGHVRRAAGADARTARWADAVERAAFGGGEVDARAENEIERLAPGSTSAAGPERSEDERR